MKTLFRRTRKKKDSSIEENITELKSPKKSILRSQDPNLSSVDLSRNDYSVSDLRSEMPDLDNFNNDCKTDVIRSSVSSLRHEDNERGKRNVLFLDQVLINKRLREESGSSEFSRGPPSRNSLNSLRSGTPTLPSLASYPTTYQPSPLLRKREVDLGIELVGRSSLSKDTQETESKKSNVGRKHSFFNNSFGRKRRSRKSSKTDLQTESNGYIDGMFGVYEGLTRLPTLRPTEMQQNPSYSFNETSESMVDLRSPSPLFISRPAYSNSDEYRQKFQNSSAFQSVPNSMHGPGSVQFTAFDDLGRNVPLSKSYTESTETLVPSGVPNRENQITSHQSIGMRQTEPALSTNHQTTLVSNPAVVISRPRPPSFKENYRLQSGISREYTTTSNTPRVIVVKRSATVRSDDHTAGVWNTHNSIYHGSEKAPQTEQLHTTHKYITIRQFPYQ